MISMEKICAIELKNI